MTFAEKLEGAVKQNNSLLCVGLDPDSAKLPASVKGSLFAFNKAIIDATADLACAFKPNSAFYEAHGSDGVAQLKQTTDYLHANYPNIPVILDYKRADIGNTNNGYAHFAFEYLGVDAITLQPYLGREALEPFLAYKDKGIIILCRTSNPGAGEFQDLQVEGKPLYEFVARQVAEKWNDNGNCLVVVGATYPEEMKTIREIVGPDMIILVPGVGAQGGDVEATLTAGLNLKKQGLIMSSSREILYASNGDDFTEASRAMALKTRDEINKFR